MDEKSKYFITDNLVLASVLKTEGFQIVGINKKNPRHSFFEFLQTDELADVVRQYWSDILLTSPKRFALSMKELKTMLYDSSFGFVDTEERRSSEEYGS